MLPYTLPTTCKLTRLIPIPNHAQHTSTSLRSLFDSSRPYSTPSYFNLRSSSSTTITSIPPSSSRPGLAHLRHAKLLRLRPWKRSSQSLARSGSVGAPPFLASSLLTIPLSADVPNPSESALEPCVKMAAIVLPQTLLPGRRARLFPKVLWVRQGNSDHIICHCHQLLCVHVPVVA